MTYLAEETDLIIYTVGVDIETEASTRPASDFITGLKNTVLLSREAFNEQFADEVEPEKATAEINSQKSEQRRQDADRPKPKEVIVITGAQKYHSHSMEQIEQIQSFADS